MLGSRSARFTIVIAAFLIGVFSASFLFPLALTERINSGYLLISLAAVLIIYLILKDRLIRFILISLLALGLGLLLYYFKLPMITANHLLSHNDQEMAVTAWICQEPEERVDQNRYHLQPLSLENEQGQEMINIRGRILAFSRALDQSFEYGDIVRFKTKLNVPKSSPEFDYSAYLANSGVYSLAYLQDLQKINRVDQEMLGIRYYLFLIKDYLLKAKNRLLMATKQVLAEPMAALLTGLLFGTKAGLPENLLEDFIRTGLIHIVVVSGYNISILIKVFVRYTSSWLPKFSFWLGSLAIVLFVVMIGSSAPAVRAGIMAWIILWGRERGREANQLLLLLVTALIMTLFNPKMVRYDIGFQLSFLAVVGLIYFSPIIEEKLKQIKIKSWLPKFLHPFLIETLSAQTLTFPLILYTFGRISIIAPLANLLVLPLIPWAMGLGFLAAFLAIFWLFLGQVIGWFEWVVLKYMIMITEKLSQLSWASIDLSWFNIYLLIFAYLLIGYLIYGFFKEKKATT